jgi:hypothetical protein
MVASANAAMASLTFELVRIELTANEQIFDCVIEELSIGNHGGEIMVVSFAGTQYYVARSGTKFAAENTWDFDQCSYELVGADGRFDPLAGYALLNFAPASIEEATLPGSS